jgi:hypothetical protein
VQHSQILGLGVNQTVDTPRARPDWDSVLRPVEIQDSTFGLFVIQASDGTIRTD